MRPLKSYTLHLYVGSWERSWLFLLPPLPIGLPLYFLKRWHFGNPTVTFPVFIVVPFVTFYLAIYLSGATIDEARLAGWFFPKTETSMFWRQYETMYVGIFDGHVEWPVLLQVIPTWLVMLLIVNLDNMLKLASTESALEIDFDYNHEMKASCARDAPEMRPRRAPEMPPPRRCIRDQREIAPRWAPSATVRWAVRRRSSTPSSSGRPHTARRSSTCSTTASRTRRRRRLRRTCAAPSAARSSSRGCR